MATPSEDDRVPPPTQEEATAASIAGGAADVAAATATATDVATATATDVAAATATTDDSAAAAADDSTAAPPAADASAAAAAAAATVAPTADAAVDTDEEGLRRRAAATAAATTTTAAAAATTTAAAAAATERSVDDGIAGLEGIVTGSGTRFTVPRTKNPLAPVWRPQEMTGVDWLKDASLLNVLLLLLPLPGWFFIVWFLFWRLGYNLFLGYLLHQQSRRLLLTRWAERIPKGSLLWEPFRWLASAQMGGEAAYDFEKMPPAYNSWLAFRVLVDVILANDVMAYVVFCLKYWEIPSSVSLTLVASYAAALVLFGFTLWAKVDAYRVVKDYAWYWGDFWFLVEQKLTFDRVFAIVPHPMYTLGYSFFYGAALLSQSYTVLYVSLIGHACQLLFLSLVENPHIEKTYKDMVEEPDPTQRTVLFDRQSGYFRRDLIVFRNFDLFRAGDLFVVLILLYNVLLYLCRLPPAFYVAQVVVWRLAHSAGLGLVLWRQSNQRWWTGHFVALGESNQQAFEHWKSVYNMSLTMTWATFVVCALRVAGGAEPSLTWWGSLLAWVDYWWLTKQALGLVLIAINVWSSVSTFEVLGEFGWFYGDFFIQEVPSKLYYTGIYRFLNNPDNVTGFAAYYGMALMSDSWGMFFLAIFSQALNVLFTRLVEQPHMTRLYGDKVRQDSGVEIALRSLVKEAVDKDPRLLKVKQRTERVINNVEATAKEAAAKLAERTGISELVEKVKVGSRSPPRTAFRAGE